MSLKRELIYIDEKDVTDKIAHYSYRGDKCVIVFKNDSREFSYSKNRAKIVRTAISGDKAFCVFNYLKEIADTVGPKTEEGGNILSKSYQSVTQVSKLNEIQQANCGALQSPNFRSSQIVGDL